MLTHLHIQNFTIIENLELDFDEGLTVITGETGAGKSIVIDALSLVLGERADNSLVRIGQDKCDITACFDITTLSTAKQWLEEQEYKVATDNECIIRRILHKDGRSRQLINGFNCTLAQLRDLTGKLINIHSQNQHHLLIKKQYQRELLDSFSGQSALREKVTLLFNQWAQNQKAIDTLQHLRSNHQAHSELMNHQIAELEKLNIATQEYEHLDQEHKQLANAQQIIAKCQQAVVLLCEKESCAQDLLYTIKNSLETIAHFDTKIQTATDLITNALINLDEASSEIRNFFNHLDLNPERLAYVENRITAIHELARKHHVRPEDLVETLQKLIDERNELGKLGEKLELLQQQATELKSEYETHATSLTNHRKKAAKALNKIITGEMQNLGMPGGQFEIQILESQEFTAYGRDHIDFLVCPNPGQTLQPLSKVASGGELSRVALAIYMATAVQNTIPILVFDEVDVGIGGSVAAIVGKLLRRLANNAQIICITHLPQVAACGNHHLRVEKSVEKNSTKANILILTPNDKIQEIARMLGGITITQKTVEHARELLESTI